MHITLSLIMQNLFFMLLFVIASVSLLVAKMKIYEFGIA